MARRCGVSDVWALMPREWYRDMIAWKEREESTLNRQTAQAWLSASLSRAKKIPALKKFLVGESAKTKPQTAEDHRRMLDALRGQYGSAFGPRKVTRG